MVTDALAVISIEAMRGLPIRSTAHRISNWESRSYQQLSPDLIPPQLKGLFRDPFPIARRCGRCAYCRGSAECRVHASQKTGRLMPGTHDLRADRCWPDKLLTILLLGLMLAWARPANAAIATDAVAFGDRSTASTTVATSTFSTTAVNELLLAFVGADSSGNTVTSVTGAGLTWQLVVRTNTQKGTAEIWRAFAAAVLGNVSVTATLSQAATSTLTVVSFTGVDTSGTNGSGAMGATASASGNSGAPAGTLTTTRNNSWVFAVGDDPDKATARTP